MSEKHTVSIICPQLKDKHLIEVCCDNLGWQLKHYESVSEALPHLSDSSIEKVFVDFTALTDYHYDIPRIDSCTSARAKTFLCIKNAQGLFSSTNPKIKTLPESFGISVFLKEMVGEKNGSTNGNSYNPELLETLIGNSAAVKEARRFCEKANETISPLLICGSFGAGKRFIAKIINQLDESRKIYLEINLLDLKNLNEWEHVNYLQVIEIIKEKTSLKKNICLYIKDIQVLDRMNQIKLFETLEKTLLKDLQFRQIRILFGSSNIQPEPQVYDFFYKQLKGGVVVIPDLNTRKRDIGMLFEYFLKQYSEESEVPQVSNEVNAFLENYRWPNNVKELRLVAAHVCINNSNGIIKTSDLPEYLQVKSFFISHSNVLEDAPRPLETFEAYYIVEILKSVNGNISKAARQLGVTRNTIKSKLKKADSILTDDFGPFKMSV